ncbi:murein hydrolase activator EnvC family protein [Agilicoccus flavus]|uniref:murein hydrolase activator EnvC family protein n=1 Tax=Agilicoccus flavus TaxID=2775968 RepID=UPI001CF6D4B5|nr:M23 family metallopeptidase [Agilicoccus flavus]
MPSLAALALTLAVAAGPAMAAALPSTLPADGLGTGRGVTAVETRPPGAAVPGSSSPGGPTPPRPAAASGRWSWPVTATSGGPPRVLRRFDPPAQRWSAGHRGVDLAAAPGAPVRAPADGVVAFAGVVAGRGVLSIDHADGLRSTFEPVVADVPAGRAVRRGDVVGRVAAAPAHGVAGSSVHVGARRGRDYVDPLLLLGTVEIVLLPP